MSEEKEIILRNEAVTEILAAPPKWIIRWGISIVFLLILIFLLLSALIRYPDTLTGNATLTTLNPTVTLLAKNNGKITSLLIANNQVVNNNQVLAVLENTANYKDVLIIDSTVTAISNQISKSDTLKSNYQLNTSLNLGDITTAYLLFLKSYKEYNLFFETNLQNREIAILRNELTEYSVLLKKYLQQIDFAAQEFKLIDKDFLRDEVLYGNKAISAKEFEDKKRAFINAQKNYENQKIILSNTKIATNNIEKNILQLQIQQYEQLNKLKQEFKQNLQALQNTINEWKQKYLIQTPVAGLVSFFNYWSVNQNIKSGEELFSVIPQQKQQIVAKMLLPVANSGKVKLGQAVNIKLSDFPYNEYGMLNGQVTNISLVPNKSNYNVDITLLNGMTTSYNKAITYKPEMQAQADIITDNKTVLKRIFFQFKKLLNK